MLNENINFRALKFVSFSSAILLLKIYSKEIFLKTETPLFTKMFTVLLMIIGKRKKTQTFAIKEINYISKS